MKIVGVMGPGSNHAKPKDLEYAYEIGKLVGKSGSALLSGGMSGVMEESARGAKEVGGLTIGIGPTASKSEINKYIDLPIMTGMQSGRNFINVISSDVLVFVTVGSPGTLSELAHAIQMEIPSIVIGASEHLQHYIKELSATKVVFVNSLEEIESNLHLFLEKK